MTDKQNTFCAFCEDFEDDFRFYTHQDCDGGYVVESHKGYYCPMCGRKIPASEETSSVHLLKSRVPPTPEDVIARQEQARIEIAEAKKKLFGNKSFRGQRVKLPLYKDTPHWIIEDKGFGGMYIECSVCGARWCDLFEKNIPHADDPCPVCGTQMDEDAKEYI